MSERFGNYELLEKVAAGGMAEIFRAVSAHGLGVQKTVCIKRIHPALSADAVFVAMFIEEARLGVSMVHGNIVPVFDFGCVDGRYYLAMEWVEGLDLATLHARARIVGIEWPVELAAYVVVEVLEGLAYAHQKRDDQGRPLELVHRDVSPSNILLSLDGQVKLLDFGIARSQAREFETRTGVIKGKPGYMSPEQARGADVDARADVWSCGAVLYELVAGVRLADERKPLPDPDLDAIVRRAIDAKPANRFSTARELQKALIAWLDGRGRKLRAGDLAEFIDRVRRTSAPGKNWDMRSSAVEQHLAAALEAAQRDLVKTAELEQTGSELAAEAPPPGDRPTAVESGATEPPKRRVRALLLTGLALGLAAVVAFALLRDRGESGPPPPAPVFASDQNSAPPPVAIADASPGDASVGSDAGTAEATGPREEIPIRTNRREGSEASRPQHRKEASGAAEKKSTVSFLSVNTVPWSNVEIDGVSLGATPIKIDAPREITSGKHVLVLTNPISRASRTIEFSVAPGEHKIVSERLH